MAKKSQQAEEKETSAKSKALQETVKEIRERFGEGSIMVLGEAPKVILTRFRQDPFRLIWRLEWEEFQKAES